MVRAQVMTDEHLFVIDIRTGTTSAAARDLVAQVLRVIKFGGAEVKAPILVAEYSGSTPGQALDLAVEAARRHLRFAPPRETGQH
jgi:hypothetical protein